MMNNENGRSMVEMLGVLAIIGVLSVAGIAGYSMAMKKYRANEILNTASQLVILAQAKLAAGNTGHADLGDLGTNVTVAGIDNMQANCTTSDDCKVSTTASADEGWVAAKAAIGTDGNGPYYDLS